MKWTVVILLVLVLVILWTTRKSSDYSNPISLSDVSSIIKPGGVSVSSMGLKGAQFLASGSLSDLNAIVSGIQTNGWYAPPFQSSSAAQLTFSTDSGSLTYRVTARAIAYAPLMMQYLCSNVGISSAGSATPAQAAGVFLDMFNLGVLGNMSVNVSNMNGAIGSNTPFASQQDFINRFNTTGAFDASVVYLLGFILGGFNSWLSGITFDTTYQPKPLGSSLTGSGVIWYPDQYIVSPGKKFFTIMQSVNGDFVTYKGSGPNDNQGWFWSIAAPGITEVPNSYALMQTDGNFVVMKPDGSTAVWRASSNGGTGPWTVALDDNGTLTVKDSTGRQLWAGPAPAPQYTQQPYITWTAAGTDLPNQPMSGTVKDCENACNKNTSCLGFSWLQNADPNSTQQCYLKQNMSTAVPAAGSGWVSYVNDRAPFNPQAPAPAGSTWTSQGCFTDNNTRVLPNFIGNVSNVLQCQQQASATGYNVYGVQNGNECWAGTNLSYDSLGTATNCNNGMGGYWSFNAYTGPGYTKPS